MSLHAKAAVLLEELRTEDGGFAPIAGGVAEPEPTALAALALDDAAARRWLDSNQRGDGGFLVGPEQLRNDSSTAIASLATEDDVRERALDYLIGHQAPANDFDPRFPHDPATRGWGWTSLTFGWVEPTALAVLALKIGRPDAAEIDDGIAVLTDRECNGGGWNYGNREVLTTPLEPFLQTTAAGLMAIQRSPAPLRDRATATIRSLWESERGGLGWSMAVVALRLAGEDTASHAEQLAALVHETSLRGDAVALGWAALALGNGWQRLEVQT